MPRGGEDGIFGIPTLPKAPSSGAPAPSFGIPTLPPAAGTAKTPPPSPVKAPFSLPPVPVEPPAAAPPAARIEPKKSGFSIPETPAAPPPPPAPEEPPEKPAEPAPPVVPAAAASDSPAERFKKPPPPPPTEKKPASERKALPPALMGAAGGIGVGFVAAIVWFSLRADEKPVPAASLEDAPMVFARREEGEDKLAPAAGDLRASGGPLTAPPQAEPGETAPPKPVLPSVSPQPQPAPVALVAPMPAAPAPKLDPEAPPAMPPAAAKTEAPPPAKPEPKPEPKAAAKETPKPKPAKAAWVFEGMVYDLIRLAPVYQATLVFKDNTGAVKGNTTTHDGGRYRISLPPGPPEGYKLDISHADFLPKYIDEIDPPFRDVGEDYRRQLVDLAPPRRPWVGSTASVIKRDMVMIPKAAARDQSKE